MALLGRQSQPLAAPAELAEALEISSARLARDPDLRPASWTLYAVAPTEVEFWQGQASRRHIRLVYRRTSDGWSRSRLWP